MGRIGLCAFSGPFSFFFFSQRTFLLGSAFFPHEVRCPCNYCANPIRPVPSGPVLDSICSFDARSPAGVGLGEGLLVCWMTRPRATPPTWDLESQPRGTIGEPLSSLAVEGLEPEMGLSREDYEQDYPGCEERAARPAAPNICNVIISLFPNYPPCSDLCRGPSPRGTNRVCLQPEPVPFSSLGLPDSRMRASVSPLPFPFLPLWHRFSKYGPRNPLRGPWSQHWFYNSSKRIAGFALIVSWVYSGIFQRLQDTSTLF